MATVYIVTGGCYSDYGIEAAFTTKELADRYVALHNNGKDDNGYGHRVEEFELDSWDQEEIWRTVYSSQIILETGDIVKRWTYKAVVNKNLRAPAIQPLVTIHIVAGVRMHCVTSGSYVSAEHADACAIEARQRLTAEHAEGLRDAGYKMKG